MNTNEIQTIIYKHLPNSKIYLFGSRVNGNNLEYSDLDIAIDNNGKIINSSTLAQIKFDCNELNMDFKIDLNDYNTLPRNIQKTMVLI